MESRIGPDHVFRFSGLIPMEVVLHRKQSLAFSSRATEILYGGAAGGGKSHLLRIKAIALALAYPKTQIYLFRRFYAELIRNHMDGPNGFRVLLDPFLKTGGCRITASPPSIRFRNGSAIFLCPCRCDHDVMKYQGVEIHALLIDELTHFSETVYRALRARCRVPGGLKGKTPVPPLPLVLSGANPGGPGHNWVKAAFIDFAEPMEIRRMPKEEGGMLRQYIPARLEDNPSLDAEEYSSRLLGLRSPYLVKAMLEGSWDIVAGGMFDDLWNPEIHVVAPFEIPSSWKLDRSFDWGASKPYSVGFWAESDGSDARLDDGSTLHTLRGDLFRIAEIYGWSGQPNEGCGHSPAEIARLILEKQELLGFGRRIQAGPADNSIFDASGRISIASDMDRLGVRWLRSDKTPGSRKRGWVLLRQMLQGSVRRESPGLFVFSDCTHFIRTIPTLPRDSRDPDDIDTSAEDHIADETRYRILSVSRRSSSGGVRGLI